MLRHYRASINIDFTKHKSNQYSKLVVALIDNGWLWVETSALIMDTTDLAKIWRGVELVAKQCEKAGQLPLSLSTFRAATISRASSTPPKSCGRIRRLRFLRCRGQNHKPDAKAVEAV